MLQKATELKGILKALDPRELQKDELPDFFRETSAARDKMLPRRYEIASYLETVEPVKILVTGHRGTGKSTELVKFQEENPQYAVAGFSMTKEAMPDSGVEALLVLIVEAVLMTVNDLGGKLDEKVLKKVYEWFDETFEYKEKDLQYTAQTGAGIDTKNIFWGKLVGFAAFAKADIKAGSRTMNKTITQENRRLSQLAYQCSQVVREGQLALKKADPDKELLLIIEDLDKMDVGPAQLLFVKNPGPLTGLPCKIIFTAPIFLLYSPEAAALAGLFSTVTIPMIKVFEQDGNECGTGREVIRDILSQRFDLDRLIETDALDLAIKKTGGVLRHLFDALAFASMAAGQSSEQEGGRKEKKIDKQAVRYGLNRVKNTLIQQISTTGLPEEYKDIETTGLYDRLKKLAGEPHRLDSDSVTQVLLKSQAVLEYNGDGWHGVHPLVAEHVGSMK